MDKKDDNKKPSKDKKKDKKDKKNKVKKINKSQIVKQSVNIKIGDLSKPKTRTRRRAAPKAPPPPPQIQRQLQYLPSLAAAPPPPAPAAAAPTPPPAPPPPRPPAPEPSRTGDFFDASERSVFGSSYDLTSATLDDLSSVGRSATTPSMTRPRSDSNVSALTEATSAELSQQPEEALGVGADFENIAAPSVVNVADNLGFVSSQQPQEIQELQPTQTPPEAQPIEAQLVEPPAVAVPVTEEPRISETLQEQAIKGDVKPEDEATGGGGRPPINFIAAMKDRVQRDLIFNRYTLEKALQGKGLDGGVTGMRDAIEKYNIVNSKGTPLDTTTFQRKYQEWLGKGDREKEINKLDSEALKAAAKKARKKAKKQFSGEAEEK